MLTTEELNDVLVKIAVDALEKLAFMFAFPEDDETLIPDELPLTARTTFSGPFCGTLLMSFSETVLPELTANMLGVDEEETSPEQQMDACRETLNVICGNLLPAIAGDQAVFSITMPEVLAQGARPTATPPTARAVLSIDDAWCELRLLIDS